MMTSRDVRSSEQVAHLCELEREASCRVGLEKTVIDQRSAKLQREAMRLARQRAFLREERKRAREEEQAILAEKENLEHVNKSDWWPERYLIGAGNPRERLRLRVGGQIFEIAKKVLQQDEGSLLYALCSDDCPIFQHQGEEDSEDVVVIDRDWWLFRFVTIFLRDGLVPEDRCTALQLYREAAFYRLESLQRAIEETHLNLTRTDLKWGSDGALENTTMDDDAMFWKNKKNWWASQAEETEETASAPTPGWWMDYGEVKTGSGFNSLATKYNGQAYGPLSSDPKKVTTEEEEEDIAPMFASTWGYYR